MQKQSILYTLAFMLCLVAGIALHSLKSNEKLAQPPSQPTSIKSSATPAQLPEPDTMTTASSPTSEPGFVLNNTQTQLTPAISFTPSEREKRHGNKANDKTIIKDGVSYPNRTYKTLVTPNDPLYNQWWVTPNGMTSVWDIPAGVETTVAVIDTGFSLVHQEFTNRWATNDGEFGATASENPSLLNCTDQGVPLDRSCNNIDDNFDGILNNESGPTNRENRSLLNCTDQGVPLNKNCNLIDDDGNGYIDDWRGFDFVNYERSVQPGETNPNGDGTTHGTMVAGVLGATGNNGVGMAGVNWHTKILPLQALDDDSYGDSYTVAEAVYYAADQGVDVISLSLGTFADDPFLRQAILYALDRNILIVAASGNDGCNCIAFPANYPEVIAVGAINPDGNRASFSNFGANLDIVAPGQSITTSFFTAANPTSSYATASGTSFATPFMSGLFALGRMSQPDAAWEEIVGTMFEASDRRAATAATPHNSSFGWGVSRADTMMDRLRNPTNTVLRYQFGGGSILGSTRNYQCATNTLPATRYYEMRRNGLVNYTANLRDLSRSLQQGWTSRLLANSCIGLPSDNIDILRVIDLPSETLNLRIKQ